MKRGFCFRRFLPVGWLFFASILPASLYSNSPNQAQNRRAFITEFGLAYRFPVLTTHRLSTTRQGITSKLGVLFVADSKHDYGIDHFAYVPFDDRLRHGFEIVARRKYEQKSFVDVAGGLLLWTGDFYQYKYPPIIGRIGATFNDWIGLDLQLEIAALKPRNDSALERHPSADHRGTAGTDTLNLLFGCKLSSRPGLMSHGIALASLIAYATVVSFLLSATVGGE